MKYIYLQDNTDLKEYRETDMYLVVKLGYFNSKHTVVSVF